MTRLVNDPAASRERREGGRADAAREHRQLLMGVLKEAAELARSRA